MKQLSLDEAKRWCSRYTASHYENFTVAARFLSPQKRDEYCTLYAFARGADNLADELPLESSRENALTALDKWEKHLDDIYENREIAHPAFIALSEVIQTHHLDKQLFIKLLDAFRQDQTVTRYQTWSDVKQYASGSANPVGRLVLRLYGIDNPCFDNYSDFICTGLQLINFLQDIQSDYRNRDRIYLPQDDLTRFGVVEDMLNHSPTPEPVRNLLRFEAQRAERLLFRGRPLLKLVPSSLGRQLILFHGGGRVALHCLRKRQFDVSGARIQVNNILKFALIIRSIRGKSL